MALPYLTIFCLQRLLTTHSARSHRTIITYEVQRTARLVHHKVAIRPIYEPDYSYERNFALSIHLKVYCIVSYGFGFSLGASLQARQQAAERINWRGALCNRSQKGCAVFSGDPLNEPTGESLCF
jgi:hypothetical protein